MPPCCALMVLLEQAASPSPVIALGSFPLRSAGPNIRSERGRCSQTYQGRTGDQGVNSRRCRKARSQAGTQMRIYMTHCTSKKDHSLKETNEPVYPDQLYIGARIQRFMNRCKTIGARWAIFSDYHGVWFC